MFGLFVGESEGLRDGLGVTGDKDGRCVGELANRFAALGVCGCGVGSAADTGDLLGAFVGESVTTAMVASSAISSTPLELASKFSQPCSLQHFASVSNRKFPLLLSNVIQLG